MSTTAAAPATTFVLRPPRWVRVWAGSLGFVALVVAGLLGVPAALSGRWGMLAPVALVVALAAVLIWRVARIAAKVTADGRLVIRNRASSTELRRDQVAAVRAGHRAGRANTPVAVVVLTDGTEIPVDASLSTSFQQTTLDGQVSRLQAWLRG